MSDNRVNFLRNEARSEWVRLRTLVLLRWLAVAGQTMAVLLAATYLELDIILWACFLAIGASVVMNLMANQIFSSAGRLSERRSIIMLLFDLGQLAILLYLTGGTHNPFALLILAPVIVSATALTLRATLFLGLIASVLVLLLTVFHLPLTYKTGAVLIQPDLFLWGYAAALLIGILFVAGYARRVTVETFSMSEALSATQMALDRQHKLSLVGGVVAAAAHEMGTPLATIKLVASELREDLTAHPDQREDIELILEQTERLRDILRDMGQSGKDDLHVHHSPLLTVVEEAAEPHIDRGKTVHLLVNGHPVAQYAKRYPTIPRSPEIIHGLRNLIQNAVDFSTGSVWIDLVWSEEEIRILIADDGRGFPVELIGQLGDPFLLSRQKRSTKPKDRGVYEGMGLGLFIAKTLIERSGGQVAFANTAHSDLASVVSPAHDLSYLAQAKGALVSVQWARDIIEVQANALGPNQRLEF